MKTSKGIVFTPKKYLEIADPKIYRTIILRTIPLKHIAFRIEELSQYYEYYEKMENYYYDVEKVEDSEEYRFFNYIFPLTQITNVPETKSKKLPLKLLTFLVQIQNILGLDKLYEKAKSYMEKHNFENVIKIEEFEILLTQTKIWIEEVEKILESEKDPKVRKEIIRKVEMFTIPDEIDRNTIKKMSEKQINGIYLLREFLKENDDLDADSIQNKIFSIAKIDLNIPPRKFFVRETSLQDACYPKSVASQPHKSHQ